MTLNLCPVSVTILHHQANCLSHYAAIAPREVEGDVIMAASYLRAAAAIIPAANDQERRLKHELLDYFRNLDGAEEFAFEISRLEQDLRENVVGFRRD